MQVRRTPSSSPEPPLLELDRRNYGVPAHVYVSLHHKRYSSRIAQRDQCQPNYAVSIQIESNTGSSQESRYVFDRRSAPPPHQGTFPSPSESASVSGPGRGSREETAATRTATASPGGRSCTTTIGTSCIITGSTHDGLFGIGDGFQPGGSGSTGSATFTTSDLIVRSADEIMSTALVLCRTGSRTLRQATGLWARGLHYNSGSRTDEPDVIPPKDLVTREQMATFLARLFAALTGSECAGTHPFTDIAVSHWAYGPVGCLQPRDYEITGPTTYSPREFVTRRQMAAFLYASSRRWRILIALARIRLRTFQRVTIRMGLPAASTASGSRKVRAQLLTHPVNSSLESRWQRS